MLTLKGLDIHLYILEGQMSQPCVEKELTKKSVFHHAFFKFSFQYLR